MSRKTPGKGMSRGISPELIEKEIAGERRPGEVAIKTKEQKLTFVPGLPRPVRRRSTKV